MCEVYFSFEGVSSDYRNITAMIKLSLSWNKKQTGEASQYHSSSRAICDMSNQYCIAMNNYTYTYACMQKHIQHNKDERTQFFRKIYHSLYWNGCVWEGVGDRTELQHIDPHSSGYNSISFPFSWAAQPGA